MFPASAAQLPAIGSPLVAANGSDIWIFGKRRITFSIANRSFIWLFTIADVPHPLLGADFLCEHALLVDMKHRRLIDSCTLASTSLQPVSARSPFLQLSAVFFGECSSLLSAFPQIASPTFCSNQNTQTICFIRRNY